MLHADKDVTNSQWCHSQKWESVCLQLLSTLINSGSGLFDGKRTAKQGRFMKLVSVAPVYFIFKTLCFGGIHLPLLLLMYMILKGSFFFHTLCQGHVFMCIAHLHPAGPSEWKPAPHLSHFSPVTPARHVHLPSASHCRFTEPGRDSKEREGEEKKKGMKFHQEASEFIKGWTRSIYHYSFGRDNRIAVIEFLCSFQMLAQNNLTRFVKQKKKMRE